MRTQHNAGSALLATLVMAFIISILMMSVTLLVNAQGRLNRQQAQHQTSRAEIERFAEETYATFSPLMNHDGTLSDHHLPRRGQAFITSTVEHPICTRHFQANPALIETGIITVTMSEECEHEPPRAERLTYQLSPDTNNIVSLLESEPTQPLRLAQLSLTASIPHPTFSAAVSTTEGGYIRVFTENPDPQSLQNRHTILANRPVTPGVNTTFTIVDSYGTPPPGVSPQRHLKILYSPTPFPNDPDELVRWTCPTGVCGATSVLRVSYNTSGAWSIVPHPTN